MDEHHREARRAPPSARSPARCARPLPAGAAPARRRTRAVPVRAAEAREQRGERDDEQRASRRAIPTAPCSASDRHRLGVGGRGGAPRAAAEALLERARRTTPEPSPATGLSSASSRPPLIRLGAAAGLGVRGCSCRVERSSDRPPARTSATAGHGRRAAEGEGPARAPAQRREHEQPREQGHEARSGRR